MSKLFYSEIANINAGQSQYWKATFDLGQGWVNQSYSRKATFDTTDIFRGEIPRD